MRNFILTLIALLVFLPDVQGGKPKADKVSVMTFNIGQVVPGAKKNTWAQRKAGCLEMFQDINPDVALLQRVSKIQMHAILEVMPEYSAIYQTKEKTAESEEKGYGQLILYNKTKFNLEENGTFYMSTTPDEPSQDWGQTARRPVLWAKFKLKRSGLEFYCFNLFPDPKVALAQEYGIETAVNRIKEITGPDAHVFVGGDLSVEPNSYYLAHLRHWMESAREKARISDEEFTYNAFRAFARKVTDHIFYRNAEPKLYQVISSKYGGVTYISEHFPVYTQFSLSATTKAGPQEDLFVFEHVPDENADSTAFVNASWEWKNITNDIAYACVQLKMFGTMQTINVIRYDRSKIVTALGLSEPKGSKTATSSIAKKCFAKAAINAGFFNMKKAVLTTYMRIGKDECGKLDPKYPSFRSQGLLLLDGHEMKIEYCDTANVRKQSEGWECALSCGPLLLCDSRYIPHPNSGTYRAIEPRTMFGYDSRSNYAYMVVVDGRFEGQAMGVTFDQLAFIAKLLGMTHAINLDGGGSSTMWSYSTTIINHPTDNKLFDHAGQRSVPSIIYIK